MDSFETRIAPKICLYRIIHEHTTAERTNLMLAEANIAARAKEWGFLLYPPGHEQLELSYLYAQLLVDEKALHNSCVAVRESVVPKTLDVCH